MKVLIVDDDPKALELVAVRILGMAGTVLRAYGGREAIDMVDRQYWDALIVDLGLPDLDGKSVIAHVRAQGNTPVVVISARNSPSLGSSGMTTSHGAAWRTPAASSCSFSVILMPRTRSIT